MKVEFCVALAAIIAMGLAPVGKAEASSVEFLSDAQMASITGGGCNCGFAAARATTDCQSASAGCPCTYIGVSCIGCVGPYRTECPGHGGLECTGSVGDGECINLPGADCQTFMTARCSGCAYRLAYCTACIIGEDDEVSCGTYKQVGKCDE